MAKVYISSTFADLQEHRQAVYGALRKLRHDVIAMEDYVATDQRPLDKCLADVALCDVYILIIAWRYGHIPNQNNPFRRSITELEYRQARLLNKRCLIFLLNPTASWPRDQMEFGDGLIKLETFRQELMNEATVGIFNTAEDLATLAAVAVTGQDTETRVRPFHNLPRSPTGSFVTRSTFEEAFREALSPANELAVTNLHGIAGVGKSTLVQHVAHDLVSKHAALQDAERFGAIVWFSAKRQFLTSRGIVATEGQKRPLRDLMAAISITLEREDIIRAPEADQPELAVKALRRQRTLLLLDDMDTVDASLAEFIGRLPTSTKIVITSRGRIVDADRFIHVGALSEDEATTLIGTEAIKKGITISSDEMRDLVRVTGRLPVAIVWSVGQIAYGFEPQTIVQRLESAGNDVARFCFEGVIDALRGTAAHRLLMALSLFASDTRKEDVSVVAGMSETPALADEGLVQLENLSLVAREGRRMNLLPLTRDFAQLELSRDAERDAYIDRWKTRVRDIASAHRPQYWYDFNATAFHREAENLRAALDWARRREDWPVFLAVISVICWYDNYIGMWNELIQTAEEGIVVAQRAGDLQVEAELRAALLGFAYSQRGQFSLAQRNVESAMEIYRDKLSDQAALAFTMCHLAQVHRKRGDMDTAEKWYSQAESLLPFIEGSHRTRIAIQFELGKLARDKRDWVAASSSFNDVRRWLDDHPNDPLNHTQLRAAVLGHLALVEYYQGDFERARVDCLESLRLFSALNLRVAFGPLFWRLAMIEHALGNHADAKDAVQHANRWFARLGMADDLRRAQELEADVDAALATTRG